MSESSDGIELREREDELEQSRVASLKLIDGLRKELREREDELERYKDAYKKLTKKGWGSCVVNPYLAGV
jgi:uncharacterized coiled-coil DUF342 family protein